MKFFRKIDLYFNGDYLCSTNQSRTCRDAVKAYLERISRGNYYNTLVGSRILNRPDPLKARFNRGES